MYRVIIIEVKMDRIEIINRISYFRAKAKLSQKALSLSIDMNAGYINRLECKQDFLPSLETLVKIIDVCNTTFEEFFYENVHNYANDSEIIAKLNLMSKDKRDALLKLL